MMTDLVVTRRRTATISRTETAARMILTVLFLVILRAADLVVTLLILYQLATTLITRRPPHPRVVDFGNRVVEYCRQIGQYMTYNLDRPPFPFDEFPLASQNRDSVTRSTANA